MNLLSLVGLRLDNIYQIRRKWYYLSGSLFLQSERGPSLAVRLWGVGDAIVVRPASTTVNCTAVYSTA